MKIINYGELRIYQLAKFKKWRVGELLEVNRRLHFTIERTETSFKGEYRRVNVTARVIGITYGTEIPQIAYLHPETNRIHCEMGDGLGFSLSQSQFKELKKL